jgi:hypothetical protein
MTGIQSMPTPSTTTKPALRAFTKETLVNGQPARLKCLEIGGQTFVNSGGPLKILGVEDEWFEDVLDPVSVVGALAGSKFKPDIFTFWQRLPDTEPKYPFYFELESISVLPIKSYDEWWNKQVKGTTRNMVRKSQKAGVEVREAVYDDEFVRGMTDIFNETPMRQGRRFWHFGKDFETVKEQFARYLFREDLIGAYLGGKLIGFVMLGNAGKFANLGQFISRTDHRDKAVNNAMIAKTVEVCARKQFLFLTYGSWAETSLVDFKRHSGFEEVRVPRYFVPLTAKGKIALRFGMHHGWREAVPDRLKKPLKQVRKFWLGLKKEGPAKS